MTSWFDSLPLHRKLTALVFGVSTVALLAASLGFVAFDLGQFRASARSETQALAQVMAENTAAAIVFGDTDAARQTLASVRIRPVVLLACLYGKDGALMTGYHQRPDDACPDKPIGRSGWRLVSSLVPVTRNGVVVGSVYLERALSDLGPQLGAAIAAGSFMLFVAGAIALGLARSLQRTISRPIVHLARVARTIGGEPPYQIPAIQTFPDETGELVHAFEEMIRRVGESNAELRAEVERRREMQLEREDLLRREREASRLKDEFLAAVSHELRTPLNAILGWTQLLAKGPPNEEMLSKATSSLLRNVQAQNRVIEDLLDVSRIISGKLQLSLTPIDLRSVVESALEVISPSGTAKGLNLEVRVPALACTVQGDYDRLRQVVWNLLSNAVKFTPAGGSVCVALVEATDRYAVTVSDTGVGIPVEFVPHVFERFRQADGSMARAYGGLGLGLAIVKELTELHGGSVHATSRGPGCGATFTVSLPKVTSELVRDMPSAAALLSNTRLDDITVLVVDDNLDALEIATSTLIEAGARVRSAASGPEALVQWRDEPPHVLLCDLAMPQMDGFELLQRIQQMDAATGHVTRALALTAYASSEHRERCLRAGFQEHIAKPYDRVALVRAVAAAMAPV